MMNKHIYVDSKYLICIILMSLPLSNSLGFDFYSHVVAFSNYEELPKIYKNYRFQDQYVPRYLLLSVFYELMARLGIPLGYVIVTLLIVPSVLLFGKKSLIYRLGTGNIFFDLFIYFTISFIVVLLTFFYSALSLTLLWALAYRFTHKKILLLCCLFHPLSLLIFIIVGGGQRMYRQFLLLFTFFLLLYFNNMFDIFTIYSAVSSNNSIDVNNINFNIIYSKSTELVLALLILILINKKLKGVGKSNTYINYSVNKIIILPSVLILSIVIMVVMIPKKTPINSIVFDNKSIVLDAAWFGTVYGVESSDLTYARYN